MNDTKSYILGMRETLAARLAARFIVFLLLFAIVCGISFAGALHAQIGGYFLAVRPAFPGGNRVLPAALALIRCSLPSAAALLAVYAAAHTTVSQAVSAAVLVWRGLCLGVTGALMANGTLRSVGRYRIPALSLYFAATVLIVLLAAVSHVYSLCFCRAHADGMLRLKRELAAEYLRIFLILSGGVFAAGGAAVLLI